MTYALIDNIDDLYNQADVLSYNSRLVVDPDMDDTMRRDKDGIFDTKQYR